VGIGERVKKARISLGFHQKELGLKLGKSEGTISRWESEERKIPFKAIYDLSTKFGISKNWLEKGEGEMFEKTSNSSINIHGGNNQAIEHHVSGNNFNFPKAEETFPEKSNFQLNNQAKVSFEEKELVTALKNIANGEVINLQKAIESVHKLFVIKSYQQELGLA
jgi:transcriptional regulator with XRE-family HTH domain